MGSEGPPNASAPSTIKDATPKPPFYILAGGALADGIMVAVFGALTLSAKSDYETSGYRDASARDATVRSKLITDISIGAASAPSVGAHAVELVDLRSTDDATMKTVVINGFEIDTPDSSQ